MNLTDPETMAQLHTSSKYGRAERRQTKRWSSTDWEWKLKAAIYSECALSMETVASWRAIVLSTAKTFL